eukprot:495961-Hanusia_phi.AAC.3
MEFVFAVNADSLVGTHRTVEARVETRCREAPGRTDQPARLLPAVVGIVQGRVPWGAVVAVRPKGGGSLVEIVSHPGFCKALAQVRRDSPPQPKVGWVGVLSCLADGVLGVCGEGDSEGGGRTREERVDQQRDVALSKLAERPVEQSSAPPGAYEFTGISQDWLYNGVVPGRSCTGGRSERIVDRALGGVDQEDSEAD